VRALHPARDGLVVARELRRRGAALRQNLVPALQVAAKLHDRAAHALGNLRVVLPDYCGSSNVAIYAVYPSREFMPSEVNVFIEFLSELYGPEPYWNKDLDLDELKSPNSTAA